MGAGASVMGRCAMTLVPIFDELLEHYKFAALKCHSRPMVSPLVIAELVLLGWRNAEDERQPKNSEELI